MDILKVAQDLIKFRTETGCIAEINKLMTYVQNLFQGTPAKIDIYRNIEQAPVFFVRNSDADNFDVLILGHIDVVAAPDSMFEPHIENGKMYARGSLDMKSFAAVALNTMEYVLQNNLPIKFGVILSSDEEKGSHGTEAVMQQNPNLRAKIVLDNDVGGDISKIILKCKIIV